MSTSSQPVTTSQVINLCEQYCSSAYLKGIVRNKMKMNQIADGEFDDYMSDANLLVLEVAQKFDPTKGVPFKAMLTNCLQNRFKNWIRDSMRLKRCQTETYIGDDGMEGTRRIQPISLDEASDHCENEADLHNVIASDFDIFREILDDEDEYPDEINKLLSNLTIKSRKIAVCIMEGNTQAQVKHILGVSTHEYNDAINEMRLHENLNIIRPLIARFRH